MIQFLNWSRFLVYLFCLLLCITSCKTKEEKTYTIGISQLGEGDAWRKSMKEEIDRELVFNPQLKIIYKEAGYNSSKQIAQINELLAQKIDLLIVSPNEAEPLTPIIDKIYKSGIPVITVDRNISSNSYNSFIGADNTEVGALAAKYAARYLKERGAIIEITGLPSSTPAKQREKGFGDELARYPGITIRSVINGDWLSGSVERQLPLLRNELQNVQLIFAHNDIMAATAAKVCKQLGYPGIKVIGVDAQAGTGLNYIEDGTLLASVLYPTGGGEAIRTAAQILNQQKVPKRDFLRTIIVDSTNAGMMQQQFNQIVAQQKDIIRQETLLKQQTKTFNTQRNLINILLATLLLLLTLSGLLVYLRRKNIRANKQLQLQNLEILSKSEQINSMAKKVQEVSEQKISFFTNVSHELKTPLTLIMAPAEESLNNPKTPQHTRYQFSLIKKNAARLLLLVNQLMDFRKIEENKMKLKVQQTDIVSFTEDIIKSFEVLARQRQIDCRLITKEPAIKAWIDPEKMEKVFFNLLSNAFKFTGTNGHIYVMLEKDEEDKNVIVKIEDSGLGMNEEEQSHLFEFFYHGTVQNENGSGVGLALSKEFVEMHKGTIRVVSEKNKGAVFYIQLPLGNAHFSEAEMATSQSKEYVSQVLSWIENYALHDSKPLLAPDESVAVAGKPYTILIVEDSSDLRDFLQSRLAADHNIIAANDGREGIKMAFEEMPDIVISDILMPNTDGIQLTKILKYDARTAHIPIILLTAKTAEENKVEGLKTKADAYITKPFNIDVLKQTIQNLLESRNVMKKHLSVSLSDEMPGTISKKNDKAFLARFNAIVDQNISNESFSIQDICNELSISKIQLYRKLKPVLDVNINEYILNKRIQKAKYLIRHEELSLSEIAYQCGFSSPSYFSTAFKKVTGETPKAYKQAGG